MNLFKSSIISIRYILITILFFSSNVCTYAQLKKSAKIEKVKSFTNGSVVLHKTIMTDTVYSVTLPNNSKYHQPIIFYLGNKDEMIKNLQDLSHALEVAVKGEIFDFSACGQDYHLSFSRTLGQKCFKIWEPINVSSDYGRFYKATIDDILEFFLKENGEK